MGSSCSIYWLSFMYIPHQEDLGRLICCFPVVLCSLARSYVYAFVLPNHPIFIVPRII